MPGLPILGNLIDFWRDPLELCRRGYKSLGKSFTLRIGPQKAAVLLEPEHALFVLNESEEIFSIREVYKFAEPVLGEQPGYGLPQSEFKKFRARVLAPPFAVKQIATYVQDIVAETNNFMQGLGDSGVMELEKAFSPLILSISARCIVGENFRQSFGGHLVHLFEEIFNGLDFVIPYFVPLPRFRRREQAMARLKEMVLSSVDLLGQQKQLEGRYVQSLVNFVGARFPKESIEKIATHSMVALLWGAHGTTSGHTSWALIQLLQHPDYLERLLAEQEAVLGKGAELDAASLRKLRCIEWAIRETERMRPVMPLIPRHNLKEYEIGGYRIPKGWLTLLCPALTHRMPELFVEPDEYDPERFSPERGGDQAARWLIGFGGGPHRCVGEHFAYLEMSIILTLLLQRYRLKLLSPDPRSAKGFVISGPENPCLVHYERR